MYLSASLGDTYTESEFLISHRTGAFEMEWISGSIREVGSIPNMANYSVSTASAIGYSSASIVDECVYSYATVAS